MKILVCANLLIGDAGVLDMPPQVMSKWQEDKIEALAEVLEQGRESGAEMCVMAGGLFAEGFIPQSLMEDAVGELGSHEIPVVWLPFEREAADLDVRVAVPEGVTVLRNCADEICGGLRVFHDGFDVEVALNEQKGASLRPMGPMEPQGFGEQAKAGYLLLEIEKGIVENIEHVPHALHPFVTKTSDMGGKESSKEMLAAIQDAIEGVDEKACLRLVLRGSTSLSTYFKTDELAQVLGRRFFYVEVANECYVAVDENELANDVSLLAEFVRMVDADDSLSATEKTRIMRCGWNALNGKELAE